MGYPTGFLGSIASFEFGYTYLKINDVKWTNDSGEAIYATYSANTGDRVELDFSGLRGKFELRKYMSW